KSPVGRRGLLAPLVALFDALMNLDDGEVRPILKKARVKGRGRASAMRESVKGVVAFTVHALHATGLPLPSARKLVARVLQKEGVTAEGGRDPQVTARTVRGWCEHVDADVSRRGEAAQTFDLLKQNFSFAHGADPGPIQRELLDRLRNLIPRTRSGKNPLKPPS